MMDGVLQWANVDGIGWMVCLGFEPVPTGCKVSVKAKDSEEIKQVFINRVLLREDGHWYGDWR